MSETKEESNSTSSVKEEEEENSSKTEDTKTNDSSRDSEAKAADKKEESDNDKEDSEKDESEEESEEEMGLLDRPVEVSGCRARKKVERLEVSFTGPNKEKGQIPEGKGKKLGECPRIEIQIQKTSSNDLKPLHRILFNRPGGPNEIKRNIRKFSGFTFGKNSTEYDKLKSRIEKLTGPVLKKICGVCDIERGGVKEEIVKRVLEFLMEPKDSGKPAAKKKTKKPRERSTENKTPKEKKASSSDESDVANDSAKSSDDENEKEKEIESDEDNDSELSKKISKSVKKSMEKKEKKEEKESKRKREEESDDSDKPASKKKKGPSDEELKNMVKKILKDANLEEVTMKKVIKQVTDAFPSVDLSHKKAFLKATIKTSIHG